MFNIKFLTNVDQLQSNYIVYQIHAENTFIVEFVGMVKMTKFNQMPDFYANNMFAKYTVHKQNFHVQVVDICSSKGEALQSQSRHIRAANWPDANKYARVSANGVITCNETGAEFSTITEASSSMGLDAAALSRHLRHVPGHLTVKGFTFTRNKLTKM